MRLQDVLMPICTSLWLCDWDTDALEQHLESRLPRRLSRMAGPLAQWLATEFPKSVAPDSDRIFRAIRDTGRGDRILAYARKTGATSAPPLASPTFRPTPALAHLPHPPLDTPEDLADWLALPAE